MPIISDEYIYNIKRLILVAGFEAAVWNKFYKRSVLEYVNFPLKGFTEDKLISTQTFYFSKNIGYYNKAYYHYMYNEDSILNNKNNLFKYYKRCNEELINFRKIIFFVKHVYGKDLSILEPELSIRKKLIRTRQAEIIKHPIKIALKKILKIQSIKKKNK